MVTNWCSQCGRAIDDTACGPTHVVLRLEKERKDAAQRAVPVPQPQTHRDRSGEVPELLNPGPP